MDAIVTARDIRKVCDGYVLVDGVDLSIAPGEFIGLVGPNGAGKTTLLRLLAKLLEPSGGAVLLEGADLARLAQREVARRVAVVPQTAVAVDFAFPVLDVVLMGRFPHRRRFEPLTAEDDALARQAMRETDTTALADRLMTELSGGERQRVVLARSLTQRPRLLLLDEPTASLDLSHQLRVLRLVRQLVETERIATVAALHDLQMASRFCDRVLILKRGALVAAGKPAEVFTPERLADVFGIVARVAPDPLTGGLAITVLDVADQLIDSV
ncbi:ABC transporter ATP-binding protein [Nitrospira sp. Kam-Ns4a]